MYIAFDKDPNEDKKFSKIMFIICAVIILFACVTCEAQNCKEKLVNSKNTRIHPCQGLNYKIDDKSIFLNIYGDSLGLYSYEFKLYVFLTDSIKNIGLTVNFDNGGKEIFYPYNIDEKNHYAEFKLYNKQVINFYNSKCNSISLYNNGVSYELKDSGNKDYFFYEFIRSL